MTHLECFACARTYDWRTPINTCECGKPLKVCYELSPATLPKEALQDREPTMWRYREVLPPGEPLTLGEGMTPLVDASRLAPGWLIKDEAVNPTASFKARGMAAAISMARCLGIKKVVVPSAGNAASAMAAYAAAAGLEAHAFVPADTPRAILVEIEALGARIYPIEGLITDCAAEVARRKVQEGWFDLSTLKEPYRAEGKKTMGYELAEQLGFILPDVIVYPTGGGTGLVGMAKAFDEMEQMGWIDSRRPRLVSAQAAGCAPLATAFAQGERFAAEFPNAATCASGLRVPRAIADFVILDAVRASGGRVETVTDQEMIACAREIGSKTGVFACPEGGATLACARKLQSEEWIRPGETVVLFNTGSGLKYLEALSDYNLE